MISQDLFLLTTDSWNYADDWESWRVATCHRPILWNRRRQKEWQNFWFNFRLDCLTLFLIQQLIYRVCINICMSNFFFYFHMPVRLEKISKYLEGRKNDIHVNILFKIYMPKGFCPNITLKSFYSKQIHCIKFKNINAEVLTL